MAGAVCRATSPRSNLRWSWWAWPRSWEEWSRDGGAAFAVQRRFPLSSLLLVLLWFHSVILIVGGHYTYARVPLGDWAMGWFGWPRNNYDKLGHFAQGFVPAILAREVLLRTSPLKYQTTGPFAVAQGNDSIKASRWLPFLVVSVCLAFSALYELIEWVTAVASGEQSPRRFFVRSPNGAKRNAGPLSRIALRSIRATALRFNVA